MKILRFVLVFTILSSSYIFGQSISVSLPLNVTGIPEGTMTVPVYINDVTGQEIESYQYKVNYNSSHLTPIGAYVYGTISSNFQVAFNIVSPGVLRIAAAGGSPLSGSGVLTKVIFSICSDTSGSSNISISELILNQGTPTAVVANIATFTIGSVVVFIPSNIDVIPPASVTIPVSVTDVTDMQLTSYQFDLTYDPNYLTPTSASITGTISEVAGFEQPQMSVISTGVIRVATAGDNPLSGSGVLVNINFDVATFGGYIETSISNFFFLEGSIIPVSSGRITSTTIGNSPPNFTSSAGCCVVEGESFTHTFTAYDPNPGDVLSCSIISGKPGWVSFNPLTATISGTPDSTQVKSCIMEVIVTDNGTPAMSDIQSFVLSVSNVDNPQEITSFTPLTAKVGIEQDFTLIVFDPDKVYNPQYAGFTQYFRYECTSPVGMWLYDSKKGEWTNFTTSLDIASTLQIKWTPLPGQEGDNTAQFSVYSKGSAYHYVSGAFHISVTANTPPSVTDINNVSYQISQAFKPIQVQASDVNDNPLSYSISVSPSNPGITISTEGLIEWSSPQVGLYNVTVHVSDRTSSSVDASRNNVILSTSDVSFSIEITPFITEPPTIITFSKDDTIMVGDDYIGVVRAQDIDNDTLTISLITAPTGMTISTQSSLPKSFSSLSTDTTVYLLWTPVVGQEGANEVTVRVSDVITKTDSSFILTVMPLNTPPTIIYFPKDATIEVGELYTEKVIATDLETPDSVRYSLDEYPAGMSIDQLSGEITWTPNLEQVGVHNIKVSVTDKEKISTASFILTVIIPPNQAPYFVEFPVDELIPVGIEYTSTVRAVDPEGLIIKYELISAPTGMVIDTTTGIIKWTPSLTQIGPHTISISASDGVNIIEGQYTINVFKVTDLKPFIVEFLADGEIGVGQEYIAEVKAYDPEKKPLTFSLTSPPTGMTIDSLSGLIEWIPDTVQLGTHTITVNISDKVNIVTRSFNLTVIAEPNQPPEIIVFPSDTTIKAETEYTGKITAIDIEGVSLTYFLVTYPIGMNINSVDGTISWTPDVSQIGIHDVKVGVTDGISKVEQSYVITVTAPPPKITSIYPSMGATDEDISITIYGDFFIEGAVVNIDTKSLENVILNADGALTGLLKAPVSEGIYDVKVMNPDGQFDILTEAYKAITPIEDEVFPNFVKGSPYNLKPTMTSAIIEWYTDEETKGYVEYGLSIDVFTKIDVPDFDYFHFVIIADLKEGTKYYYRVGAIDKSDNGPTIGKIDSFLTETEIDNIQPSITLFEPVTRNNSAIVKFNTKEDADALILYRVYESGATFTEVKSGKFEREHNILIENLTPSTKYEYRIKSTDPSANTSEKSIDVFGNMLIFETKAEADVTLPILESVRAENITDNSASIVWYTKESSSSIVEYGLTTIYDNVISVDIPPSPTKNEHIVELTNLISDTTYHYRVKSTDISGNSSPPSGDNLFKTRKTSDTKAPEFTVKPSVSGITISQATIYFETNEYSDTKVKYRVKSSISKAPQVEQYKEQFDKTLTKIHTIAIDGLSADTKYEYIVYTMDASRNEAFVSGLPFKTKKILDVTPPKIVPGGIPYVEDVKQNSVIIKWKTDEYSSGIMEYGLDLTYGSKKIGEPGEEHSVFLDELEAGKLYHYRVSSADQSGNIFIDIDRTFKTGIEKDITKPEITSPPLAKEVERNTATIEWETNEVSTSFVEFWTKDGVPEKQGSSDFVKKHKVKITGLSENTDYYYKVISMDNSPNKNTSVMDGLDSPLHTLVAEDITPPCLIPGGAPHDVDKDIYLSSEETFMASLTIEWITNEPSDSRVDYGIDINYGNFGYDGELVIKHSIFIDELLPDTIYHYRVTSIDANNNEFVAIDRTFRTLEKPDTEPPKATELPYVSNKTTNTALIEWSTDEDSDSYVNYWIVGEPENVMNEGYPDVMKIHKVLLTNLKPGTYYQYGISSTDVSANQNKLIMQGTDSPFRTLKEVVEKPLNIILGPDVSNVTTTTATIVWETDNIAISILEYSEVGSELVNTVRTSNYSFTQKFELTELKPNTEYKFSSSSVDKDGNEIKSKLVKSFRTLLETDVIPPKIIEGPIADIKDEVVSYYWVTHENSDSYVFYKVVGSEEAFSKKGSPDLVKEHNVIVTDLIPGTEYWFVVSSTDFNFNTIALFPVDYVGDSTLFKRSRTLKIAQPPGGTGRLKTEVSKDIISPEITYGPVISNITKNSASIKWSTDENSNSFVYYGLNGEYTLVKGTAFNVTGHEITLTNLETNETYNYKVASTDLSQNGPTFSEDLVFTTKEETDIVPPIIKEGPKIVSVTDNEATVLWKTDEPSDSYAEFGLDSTFGKLDTIYGPTLSTSLPKHVIEHKITMTNLLPDTIYHVRVASVDIAQNGPTYSEKLTFRTVDTPDLIPPSVIDSIQVISISDKSVTIKWVTDELSDSFVKYDSTKGLEKKLQLLKTGKSYAELLKNVVGSSKDVFEHIVTITELSPETEYTFQGGSIDKSNNKWESGLKKFTTLPEPDQTPPSKPQNLVIIPGSKALMLTWSPNIESDLAGYNVYKKIGNEFKEIYSQVIDTFFIDTGLENDSTYYYKITAVDKIKNESEFSIEKSGIPNISSIPTAPVGLSPINGTIVKTATPTLTIINSTTIRDICTYDFIVSTDSTFNTNVVIFITGCCEGDTTTCTTLKTPLEDLKKYYWRARACDGCFYSNWMETFNFTTGIPVAIELITFKASEFEGKVILSWETASEENNIGYVILRSDSKNGDFIVLTENYIKNNEDKTYKFIDENIESNKKYYYRLESIDINGMYSILETISIAIKSPKNYALYQNYPNPFNPTTNIKFDLPREENVTLKVYNILGQEVKTLIDRKMESGFHSIEWDGTNNFGIKVSSGVYIYQIRGGKFVQAKRMLFLR